MESLTRPINLQEILYPVFRLGEEKPHFSGGVVFYYRQYVLLDDEVKSKILIVDDRNIPGTFVQRRLSLLKDGAPIKKIGKAVFFLGDLIKIAKAKTWFIDSSGNVFQYKKSRQVKLVFKKLKKVIPIKTGGAIIEVDGYASRFKMLHTPDNDVTYAGILQDSMGPILYGLYKEKHKDTVRMI